MKRILMLVSIVFALHLRAADWPQFRGPDGNSIARGEKLPARIDSESIVWSADLPGRGLSSPIIIGDFVFVTCSSGPKQERLHVICFDARDGSKRWERTFRATGRTMCHEKTAVAAPSPASDGRRVYALFSSNDLVCLDFGGNLVWLRGLTLDYVNASNSLGMSSSLCVADGTVVAVIENDSESYSVGLDAETGLNRWKLARPKLANWTSPVRISRADGTTLVALQSGRGITAVTAREGAVLWDYTEGAATIPSSVYADGILYVPSHGVTALDTRKADGAPERLWRSGQLRPSTPSLIVLDGRVFTMNDAGVLTCADATDGRRVWQLRLKGPHSASPVAADGKLYCVNEAGLIQVVDTAAPEGEILGEWNLGQTVLSTPAIAGGSLYVRSDARLWRLGRAQ